MKKYIQLAIFNINFKNQAVKALLPQGIFVATTVALSLIGLKLQKQGSRVADMLALKEMEDVRNFADYSQTKENAPAQQVIDKPQNINKYILA